MVRPLVRSFKFKLAQLSQEAKEIDYQPRTFNEPGNDHQLLNKLKASVEDDHFTVSAVKKSSSDHELTFVLRAKYNEIDDSVEF